MPLSSDTPEVTTALLKFVAEFVLNKTQRLTFDSSSPNGILLFREVSKVGCLTPVQTDRVVVDGSEADRTSCVALGFEHAGGATLCPSRHCSQPSSSFRCLLSR
jgi:hypothetical protein